MSIRKLLLFGDTPSELDIEIRYHTASARIDNINLIIFMLKKANIESVNTKRTACISKILNKMRREGSVQYYVTPQSIEVLSTEAQFLINKYENLVYEADLDHIRIYVSI